MCIRDSLRVFCGDQYISYVCCQRETRFDKIMITQHNAIFIQPLAYYLLRPFGQPKCDELSQYFLINFAPLHASIIIIVFGGILLFCICMLILCGILCLTHLHLMFWGIFHVLVVSFYKILLHNICMSCSNHAFISLYCC